jgi:hypothetical protein
VQNCSDFLSTLHRRGIRIWIQNGQLCFKAPKGSLLPEELDKLRALKNEVIAQLEQAEATSYVPLRPREAGCQAPLTAVQALMWDVLQHSELTLSIGACIAPMRIFGSLDTRLLRSCIEFSIRRHESLRTRIVMVKGSPRQHIDAPCEYDLEVIDLPERAASSVDQELRRFAEAFVTKPVDLSVGPLFAAKLFKLSSSEHVLILTLEHIIADGVSTQILSEEIWTLYDQGLQGLQFSLPQLPVQFADYAVWQERVHTAWLKEHATYWKEHLTGASHRELPVDDRLVEAERPSGAMLRVPFGIDLSTALADLARREGTLLALVILTIYVAGMSHWCNQRDLLVAFVSNGRDRPELANMIGNLAYHLYLRIRVASEDTFRCLLKRIILEFYSACAHQDFGWVPTFVPECRDSFLNAELYHYFNWLPAYWFRYPDGTPREDNRQVRVEEFLWEETLEQEALEQETHLQCKFQLHFCETVHGISGVLFYRRDLFPPHTVKKFGCTLRLLAEEFARRPHGRVSSMLTG